MISHLLILIQGEWFKLSRRWLPWILLVVIILVSQAFLWGFYAVHHITEGEGTNTFLSDYLYTGDTATVQVSCFDLLDGRLQERIQPLSIEERLVVEGEIAGWGPKECSDYAYEPEKFFMFLLPTSIVGSIYLLFLTGLPFMLIMILSASLLGSEYGWGTLRVVVSRGLGRWQLISAKLILCVLVAFGWLAVMVLLNVVSSILAGIIPPDEGVSLIMLPEGDTWPSVLSTFGKFIAKALYATVPYICLGTFFVVLTQSTAQGISLSVVTYVAEAMVIPALLAISEKLERINEGLLSSNVREWISLGDSKAAVALKGAETPDTVQAFLVILAYSLVMLVASIWLSNVGTSQAQKESEWGLWTILGDWCRRRNSSHSLLLYVSEYQRFVRII